MDAHAWDDRYAAAGLVWSQTPNQLVASELAVLPPGRALDLACGEGRNALWLAARGWRVTGVDFSRVALDKARALQQHHGQPLDVTWLCADALTWAADAASYDLVLLAYLQLSDDERRTAVRRSFLALRPGGTFLLVAHDATNLAEGTGGPTDPTVLFTAEDVLADLDGERFEVERAERVAREVAAGVAGEDAGSHQHQGDGGATRTAYDALVRLVRA